MYSHISYITTVAIPSTTYQTTDFISQAAPDSGFSTSTLFPPGNADVSPQLMQLDSCHLGSLGKAHLAPSAAHHEDMAMAAGTRVKMCEPINGMIEMMEIPREEELKSV